MADIQSATRLWIVTQTGTKPVVAPGLTGMPEPIEPPPVLMPAAYIDAASNGDPAIAIPHLSSPTVSLITMFPGPDGLPATQALLFTRVRDTDIPYQSKGRTFQGQWATEYDAARANDCHLWNSDLTQGKMGCFLIGSAHHSNIWRVLRGQADHHGRLIFTLVPVKPATGLPQPNFAMIDNAVIRAEMQNNWDDMVHAHSADRVAAVVTSAKQVVENLLYYVLLRDGYIQPGNQELAGLLKHLHTILADKDKRKNSPFGDLDYHLMQKLRILHGGTHIGRVMIKGRAISPEYGMTVALDLVEILTSFGAV